jgi:hypothetical protein
MGWVDDLNILPGLIVSREAEHVGIDYCSDLQRS